MSASAVKNASLKSRFVSGGSWALAGKITSSAATLGVNILLARLLSPEDMGAFFLAFSIVSIFTIIAQWGLGRGIVKLVASELAVGNTGRARSAILSSFIITACISFVVVVLLNTLAGEWFLSKLSGTNSLAAVSGMLGLWVFVLALQGIASESFRGYHDIRMATIFGGMLTAIVAMLLYLSVWLKSGRFELVDAVQLMAFATAVSLLIAGFFLSKKIAAKEHGAVNREQVKKVFRFGLPLMLTNLSLFATLEFHIWILAYYQPETEVALYGAALRLVLLLAIPLTIINAVIPPMVADMYSLKQYKRVQNLLQQTATIIGIPAFIVFLAIIFYGDELLGLVYGAAYTQAYIAFVILAVGQLINVFTGSPGILLTMSGHERVVFKTALYSSVLGLVVSFVGVQIYGAAGAALGYAVGVIVNNLGMWLYSYNKLSIRTHGSLAILRKIIRRIRAIIESDEVNGGRLCFLGKPVSKLELFWWRLRGFEVIECFGDSHVAVFRGLNSMPWIGRKRFRVVSVKGATAYGVGNPNSKTNALEVFMERLEGVPAERTIVFMMGEVDVGFLVWLRAKNKGVTAISCMEEAFDRYTSFLNNIKNEHPNIKLCSVPLPTISDGEAHGDVANARSSVVSTQKDRTLMTLKFNEKLKIWASENNVEYMDFDLYALDSNTNLVHHSLLNTDVSDHHYNNEAFYSLIKKVFNY